MISLSKLPSRWDSWGMILGTHIYLKYRPDGTRRSIPRFFSHRIGSTASDTDFSTVFLCPFDKGLSYGKAVLFIGADPRKADK